MNIEDAKKASVDEIFKQFSSSMSGLSSQEAEQIIENADGFYPGIP